MLITGIGYRIQGSQHVKYILYALAFLFFFIFPYFLIPRIRHIRTVMLNPSGLLLRRAGKRPLTLSWDQVQAISLTEEILVLKTFDPNREKTLYIEENEKTLLEEAAAVIGEKQIQIGFSFQNYGQKRWLHVEKKV